MSDHAIIANGTGRTGIGVDDGIVLDVGSGAHMDGIGIAAQHGTKPNGGAFFNDDISDGDGVGGYEGGRMYLRGLLQFLQ